MDDSLFDSLNMLLGDINKNSETSNDYSSDSNSELLDGAFDINLFDMSKTAYIVCEKQSFRTDALCNALSKLYTTKIDYFMTSTKFVLNDALFCIVDITNLTGMTLLNEALKNIQTQLIKQNATLFILGEKQDIKNIQSHLRKSELNIIEVKRPISMDDIVNVISNAILQSSFQKEKKHIFAVDDSITFLKLVQKTLEKKYRVTITTSAFECIRTLGTLDEPPDLIIIDYMMPTCDGLTLCKMIKDNDFTKDVPVIFYSGNNNVNEIIQLMPMIDGYLLKSQPINTLEEYLETIFEKKEKEKKSLKNKDFNI